MRKLIYLVTLVLVFGIAGSASADLVAYYDFETGSGTIAYDRAANPANGTINGDPGWLDVSGTGKAALGNYALDFDGAGDYVACNKPAKLDITSAITLAYWVKVDSWGNNWTSIAGRYHPYFSRRAQSGNKESAQWRTDGTADANGTLNLVTVGTTSIRGAWHHIAGTYDGATGEQYFYIDGVLESSAQGYVGGQMTYAGAWTDFNIAADHNGGNNQDLDGQVDEVGVWDEALSQATIQGYMNNGIPEPATVLLLGIGGLALVLRKRRAH